MVFGGLILVVAWGDSVMLPSLYVILVFFFLFTAESHVTNFFKLQFTNFLCGCPWRTLSDSTIRPIIYRITKKV